MSCECGCGQQTPLAKKTNSQWGHKKDVPLRFIKGHQHKGKTPWNKGRTTLGVTHRKCSRCGETRELEDFKPDKKMYLGRSSTCKSCCVQYSKSWRETERGKAKMKAWSAKRRKDTNPRWYEADRNRSLRRHHGITIIEYSRIYESQGRLCGICKSPKGKRELAVDHDHATGQIRGLLCGLCNKGLGQFRDDIGFLMQAALYLVNFRQNHGHLKQGVV